MKEKGISDEHKVLKQLVNVIQKLTSQCPPEFRSEVHKIRHLSSAVLNTVWSEALRANIVQIKYSLNKFVTAFHVQIDLLNEKRPKTRFRMINDMPLISCLDVNVYNQIS